MTLLMVGDVMTGRGIDQVLAHPAPPELHEAWVRDARDYVRLAERVNGPVPAPLPGRYPWGDALAHIERARPQVFVANLETAVTARGRPWPHKGIHYRMNPANVDCLQEGRVDVCALANNHVLDWHTEGLADTLRALAAAGLRTAGAGADAAQACAPAALPLSGTRRLLVFSWAAPDCGVPPEWEAEATRPGIALLHDLSDTGLRQVAAAAAGHRAEGDLVMLSLHWGANWVDEVPAAHRRFARRVIDEGLADVVHGHSSHHPLPFELHRGRLILYGCGDLINDYEGIGPREGFAHDEGCLYFAALARDGRLERLHVVPLLRRALRLADADERARAAVWHALGLEHVGPGWRIAPAPDAGWMLEPTAPLPRSAVEARPGG